MTQQVLLAGLGLKPEHYEAALACEQKGLWFEVHPENYFVMGGPRLQWLERIRAAHPVSLHGVSLSLGGSESPDRTHIKRFSELVRRIEPALVSEHLAWSRWRGQYFPDLLPFVRTSEALRRVASNIDSTQQALGRRIAIENPSHYLQLEGHEWDEIDFLDELSHRTGCGLLLDVNNVHISANNLNFNALDYIDRFPAAALMEIHVAGHTIDPALGKALLIDSHDETVSPDVWALYRRLVERTGPLPTLIERDGNLPDFQVLLAEGRIANAELLRMRSSSALRDLQAQEVAA
ncbi:MAG: DUF692 domain-containing protein [Proteobacteria bacterium]|nr:DUF692 domain-containing protein [Pseudomonadota bacterium]